MLESIVQWGLIGIATLMTVIEVSPIKINPWSAIGRIVNSAVLDEIKSLKSEHVAGMNDVNDKIADLRNCLEESEAKAARMRIQRFADEMYIDVRHSREHFDLILMDITAYNNYCEQHPGFINEKTRVAQDVITEAYEKCIRERSFRV